MMTKAQQDQTLAFITNCINILTEQGFSRADAEIACTAAVACLYGAVFDLKEGICGEFPSDFAAQVIQVALVKFYGPTKGATLQC